MAISTKLATLMEGGFVGCRVRAGEEEGRGGEPPSFFLPSFIHHPWKLLHAGKEEEERGEERERKESLELFACAAGERTEIRERKEGEMPVRKGPQHRTRTHICSKPAAFRNNLSEEKEDTLKEHFKTNLIRKA